MKNNSRDTSVVSIGFGGLLTLIFITLKLCGVIAWSWWWVLSPLWIPLAIAGIIVLVCVVAATVSTIIDNIREKKDK